MEKFKQSQDGYAVRQKKARDLVEANTVHERSWEGGQLNEENKRLRKQGSDNEVLSQRDEYLRQAINETMNTEDIQKEVSKAESLMSFFRLNPTDKNRLDIRPQIQRLISEMGRDAETRLYATHAKLKFEKLKDGSFRDTPLWKELQREYPNVDIKEFAARALKGQIEGLDRLGI